MRLNMGVPVEVSYFLLVVWSIWPNFVSSANFQSKTINLAVFSASEGNEKLDGALKQWNGGDACQEFCPCRVVPHNWQNYFFYFAQQLNLWSICLKIIFLPAVSQISRSIEFLDPIFQINMESVLLSIKEEIADETKYGSARWSFLLSSSCVIYLAKLCVICELSE